MSEIVEKPPVLVKCMICENTRLPTSVTVAAFLPIHTAAVVRLTGVAISSHGVSEVIHDAYLCSIHYELMQKLA